MNGWLESPGLVTVELMAAQALFAWRLPRRGHAPRRALCAVAAMLACCLAVTGCSTALPAVFPRLVVDHCLMFAASCVALGAVARCGWRTVVGTALCGYVLQQGAAALAGLLHPARMALAGSWSAPWLASWGAGEAVRALVFVAAYAAAWRWLVRTMDVSEIGLPSAAPTSFLAVGVPLAASGLDSHAYAVGPDAAARLAVDAFSVLACMIVLALFGGFAHSRTAGDEPAFVRRMDDLRADHYTRLRDMIEETDARRDDLKRRLARLRVPGATAYDAAIDEIADAVDGHDRIAGTGNPALDAVLIQAGREAARRGVRFSYMAGADCTRWMDDRDVYSLFGNALDNAIEAAARLDDPALRTVRLTVIRRADLVGIHVSNYYEGARSDEDGMPTAVADDAPAHGYGIASMRMTVERLGGDMSVSADDGVFELDILLPAPVQDRSADAVPDDAD